MFRFGKLRYRIIILTTVPLIALLGLILASTIKTANSAVRTGVRKSLTEAGSVVVRLLTTRKSELLSMAQVTARDPRFFATFSIPESERGPEFAPTVEGITREFLQITGADFLEIFDARGEFVAAAGASPAATGTAGVSGRAALAHAMKGASMTDFYERGGQLVTAAVVPVYVTQRLEAIVRLGTIMDQRFVRDVKRLTGADVTLAHDGTALASTFPTTRTTDYTWAPPDDDAPILASQGAMTLSEAFTMDYDGVGYLAQQIRINGVDANDRYDVFIGRELRTQLAPIITLEKQLAVGGALAVLITLLIGILVSSSITKPLSSIVRASDALSEGKYDYPVEMRGRDEVAALGRNFARMRESLKTNVEHLQHIDQVKSNFIALAGHELRTPLTIITGFTEMIGSGALGEVPEKIEETTELIKDQLTSLNQLVQNMLDLTYFEQGNHDFIMADTDLRAIVAEVIHGRRDAAAGRHQRFVEHLPADPVPVRVDPGRMMQAVAQLVDNAIRFTPDDGTVTVSVTTDGDQARVTVRDTGVGIAPKELNWIFEKIYDPADVMHHTSGKYNFGSRGFGLGLALCKAIVVHHGGEVQARSTPGRGSEFAIVLDMVRPEAPVNPPAGERREGVPA